MAIPGIIHFWDDPHRPQTRLNPSPQAQNPPSAGSVLPTSPPPSRLLECDYETLKQLERGFIVNNQERLPEFLTGDIETGNSLFQYVQSLSPETVAKLSKPDSAEVFQVMERNIIGLLGALPPDSFDISITTTREDLGRLLASAMMSGYFLRKAEQRMDFEKALAITEADRD